MGSGDTGQPMAPALVHMRARMKKADALYGRGLSAAKDEADILEIGRTILDLCEEVRTSLESLSPVRQASCARGCDACCRSQVQVTPVFAILAVHHALHHLPQDRRAVVLDRLDSAPQFCPFLFDGACSIYSVRPMVCRGYYSFDLALCLQGDYCESGLGYQGEHAHNHHQFMIFLFALEKHIETISAEHGLQGGPVFLHSAARTLVRQRDGARRWLAGQAVFDMAADAAGT